MAKKKGNERCPLQAECEKVCQWQGSELDCPYYEANARDGYEIEDQEERRRERWRQGEFDYQDSSYFGIGDDDDGEDDAESPTAAENAAVAPPEDSDEDLFPAEVLPSSLHLDGSQGVTEKIKLAMYEAAKQFVYIGYLLWEVQQFRYYREKGYDSVYEYAEVELGFKRSSTKNFISIASTFGNEHYGKFNGSYCFRPTMFLKPAYRDFNYSQLCEMLSMSDKQRDKVTPDMTVKQIREIKREVEPDLPPDMETIPIPLSDDPVPSGQTSGHFRSTDYFLIVNGLWVDCSPSVAASVVGLANITFDPDCQYDITIKLHKDT